MQQVPLIALILLTLAAIAAALLLLRKRWPSLGAGTRRNLLLASLIAIGIFLTGRAAHWVTSSDRLNCAFYWAALSGYALLLTVHSLNRPRWLTSLSAIILIAPVFSASLLLPLGSLFRPFPRRVLPLGDNLYVSWQRFTEFGTSTSGVDIDIVSSPPHLPFLWHGRLGGRFYDRLCNAAATEVKLQPDRNTVFIRCPSWPNSAEHDPGAYIRLH